MDFQEQPLVVTPTPTGFNVKLIGAVHTNNAWIEGEFKKIVAAKPADVALDLSATTFMSSSGVGLLVWLHNKLAEAGGAVRIVAIRKNVLTTLKYAQLARMLHADTATLAPG
ncbi:MAG TPA: STAS domain-containing protein [Humisphaera sp.]